MSNQSRVNPCVSSAVIPCQQLSLDRYDTVNAGINKIKLNNDQLQSQALDLCHENSVIIQSASKDLAKIEHQIEEKIRLSHVRKQYNAGIIDILELVKLWNIWKNQNEYIVLQNEEQNKIIALLCSKRGNAFYQFRVNNAFKDIDKLAYDLDYDLFKPNDTNKQTNALFVTLTYNTKLKNESNAWQLIGKDFNIYISNLRRKYGKVSFIRCFESFTNGYPHAHVLLLFDSKQFEVFEHYPHNDIMQGSTFRIQEKK